MRCSSPGMKATLHGNRLSLSRVVCIFGPQVCEQNGRARAIPDPPAAHASRRGLGFGGSKPDTLHAADGMRVLTRQLNLRDLAPWSVRVAYPGQGV